ncbi:MAG: hypothetical protein KDA87_18670 [Planctomycetales bacterium]|nr:hypothetical protein [Planctomycetales bacterium]
MPTRLYLDSARMGLLSERARLAHFDYVRLAATEGCSLYFSQLLEKGFSDWPENIRLSYPALEDWKGVLELDDALKRFVGVTPDCRVLMANRTAQLVKLAVRELCRRCRRVLVSDLTWPSYRRIFEAERSRCHVGVSTVSVRTLVRRGGEGVDDIVGRFVRDYSNMGCDGLFIPAISHEGIRLPVDDICERLNGIRPLKYVVVDGAQALGHVSDQLGLEHCDVFIAGTHKWLQGHLPMGVAFLPNRRSASIARTLGRLVQDGQLDDPLLLLISELKARSLQRYSETVNLASLFTCRAALTDGQFDPDSVRTKFSGRLANARRFASIAYETNWTVLPSLLPTGIVMLQANDRSVRQTNPMALRDYFASHSISVSTYEDGMIRAAMPSTQLTNAQLDAIAWALRWCRVDLPTIPCEIQYGAVRA